MKLQRRLAAQIIGCSGKRILFDENKLEDIKEAITKSDIRNLIGSGSIIVLQKRGVSRARANKRSTQKRKGRLRGYGSRKGRINARGDNRKRTWINKIRLQRRFISMLKNTNQIDKQIYNELYRKSKGGFFRSKSHILVYLGERGILKAKK